TGPALAGAKLQIIVAAVSHACLVSFLLQGAGGAGHPVLYELSSKYGLRTEQVPESELPNMLEDLKEHIRREIRKELKIKEGAEKLREVAADRRSVAAIVKAANGRLCELQAELHELEGQIILTQGLGQVQVQSYGLPYGQPTLLQTPATPPSSHHNGRGKCLSTVRLGVNQPHLATGQAGGRSRVVGFRLDKRFGGEVSRPRRPARQRTVFALVRVEAAGR
ncbi:serine/threonine-protein kinase N1-like, partial [Frankliniella occidentalis]|uniref:Serine/threonine-protein kinase N1-like n=1 Tax=Frankliniella occidentalis TaxID=133901 RepID=A0A9C6X1L0_FRAOC